MLHVHDVVGDHGVLKHLGDPARAEAAGAPQRRQSRCRADRCRRRAPPVPGGRSGARAYAAAAAPARAPVTEQPRTDWPMRGVGRARLHRPQTVAGGIETGHIARAIGVRRPDALRLVRGHAGGGPADDRVASALLSLEGDGRMPLVRRKVQVQIEAPRRRQRFPSASTVSPRGGPAPLGTPAETAKERGYGLIRPARVRVRRTPCR